MTNHRQLNKAYVELMKALQINDGAECEKVPEMFFPQGQDMTMLMQQIRFAKNICAECPIKIICLDYALEADEPFGIWGGLTPTERQILRKRRTTSTEAPQSPLKDEYPPLK